MTGPVLADGWLLVPCDAADEAVVRIAATTATGQQPTTDDPAWQTAFRGWHDSTRVAQVRPASLPDRARAWLDVDGTTTPAGRITRGDTSGNPTQ